MLSFSNQQYAPKMMNRDGVVALFRRVGGFAAMLAATQALNTGSFIPPSLTSQLDGSPRWSLRDCVEHIVESRSTFEAAFAAALLQVADETA